MNFYEHHIGDYDKNTSHLTACEDGIYSRMIRRYYDKERPLDADVKEVKRLMRARTREEMAAVDTVLREFFHLEADGWHHEKCDAVLAAYLAAEPDREAKKKNEDTRLQRHRAERAALFAVINAAGEHMLWNAPIADVRAVAARISAQAETAPATKNDEPATPPATATATPATATNTRAQSPLPTSQKVLIQNPDPPSGDPPPLPAETPSDRAKPAMSAADLEAVGVDRTVAEDWLKVRKAKRAPLTATAFAALEREAAAAGITTPQAVLLCAERGWQSFKAEYQLQPQLRLHTAVQPTRKDVQLQTAALMTGALPRRAPQPLEEVFDVTPRRIAP